MSGTIETKFKNSPSFSIRAKLQNITSLNQTSKTPAPNYYSPEKLINNSHSIKFPKSKRTNLFQPKQQLTPGPGHYESNKNINLNKSSVDSLRKIQTFFERFHQKRQKMPGPGAYNVKNDFKKTLPTFSIGTKIKTQQQIQLQKNKYKPSPGAYHFNNNQFKNPLMISIPKSERMKVILSKSPGPGNYQYERSLSDKNSFGKKSFSNTKRDISFHIPNISPGPGKYNSETSFQKNQRRKAGFSCRQLIQSKRQTTPGPGQYQSHPNIMLHTSIKVKMPKSKRKYFDEHKRSQTPGPGNYQNLNQYCDKFKFKSLSAPKFSKTKLETLTPLKNSGPQRFYDSKLQLIKKKGQFFSISSSKRISSIDKNNSPGPGPGMYNPETTANTNKYSITKFPSSSRSNTILNSYKVGPGSYRPQLENSEKKGGCKFPKSKRVLDLAGSDKKSSALRMSQHSYIRNQSTGIGKLNKL